jgi:hypothetical protein
MKGEKLQMRINLLSSFAAGLLIATSICSVAYFSDKSDVKTTAKTSENHTPEQVQLSEIEMKNKLESAGYVVQTKAEYDKNIKKAKTTGKKTTSPENNNKTVTQVIVNVSEGMTSIDVGKMLVDANLIPDAFEFSKDIERRKLEQNLRPGKFVVDSSMSYDQIISTIFKK